MVQSPSWEANFFAASQEIPRISRNPKVHYRTHKRPRPVSILGHPNPVHITTSHLLEIHFNIIHSSTPRSPQWSLFLRFLHQQPIHLLLLTHTRHMPSPSLEYIHWCYCCYCYYYYYYYYVVVVVVSCHRPFLPGTSPEPAVISIAQASSFTLQYFPYYVWCSAYSCPYCWICWIFSWYGFQIFL